MTPKQHQFAREVVLGKSQADAYRWDDEDLYD